MVPNGLQQLLAAAHQASVMRQVDQELELQSGQSDGLAIDRHFMSRDVDAETLELEPVGRLLGLSLRTSEDSAQAEGQLPRAVGLGHEIIRAEFEGEDAIDFVILTGDQDHGFAPRLRSLSDPFEDVGGAHVGQLVLDHQDGGVLPRQEANGAFSVRGAIEIRATGA